MQYCYLIVMYKFSVADGIVAASYDATTTTEVSTQRTGSGSIVCCQILPVSKY